MIALPKDRGPLFVALATLASFFLLWEWSSGVKDVVTFGGFAFVLVQVARRKMCWDLGGFGWPLLAWLAACALSCVFSIDARFSWRSYWKLLELAAGLVALIHLLRAGRRLEIATDAITGGFALAALCDLARLVAHHVHGIEFQTDGRWGGSHYGFPTIAAAVHATGFVLSVGALVRCRSLALRGGFALALAVQGYLLLSLQTRSVFVGLAAGFVVLALGATRERKRVLIALATGVVVMGAALVGSPAFRAKIVSGTFSDRMGIWKDAVTCIRLQPATGLGYGHGIFYKVHRRVPRSIREAEGRYNHAHNMLLEATIETGWPGISAWLLLLGTAAWRIGATLRRSDGERRAAVAALAAALTVLVVYGQFSAFFALAPIYLFWNLLGVAVSASTTRPRTE